jgi:hypothetical protein
MRESQPILHFSGKSIPKPLSNTVKENKSDVEYKESWCDPRLPKTQKEEQTVKPPVAQKKNRGRRM